MTINGSVGRCKMPLDFLSGTVLSHCYRNDRFAVLLALLHAAEPNCVFPLDAHFWLPSLPLYTVTAFSHLPFYFSLCLWEVLLLIFQLLEFIQFYTFIHRAHVGHIRYHRMREIIGAEVNRALSP